MGGCCWSPPWVKLQTTGISLFVFCTITISLSITNFCLQYLRNDNDHTICNGQYYWLDGVWASLFSLIGAIIAWVGSCKKMPEAFTVLYRVQATFATIGMITAMGWLGYDIYVLIEYGNRLNAFCTDIFYIWISEVSFVFIVWINTIVASIRLGCCCIVGCPSNSINPMDPVIESIEEREPGNNQVNTYETSNNSE